MGMAASDPASVTPSEIAEGFAEGGAATRVRASAEAGIGGVTLDRSLAHADRAPRTTQDRSIHSSYVAE